MRITSVNVGQAEPLANAKASGVTGIFKRPIEGPVSVSANGLVSDVICDTENHGGPDQAVYLYGVPDYQWWSNELGYELLPGTFGENVTIAGLECAAFAIGDRLHMGTVILEITAPRIPCVTLARRMGEPAFLKRFRYAERPGLYCRVIQEGQIQTGDLVTYLPYPGEVLSAIELFRTFYEPALNEETLRRHLAAPIAIRDRLEKEQQLKALQQGHHQS